MRLIFTILLMKCFYVNATIYYVSNAGSDVATGTTIGTAWQTISKVNSSTTTGDTVLFKKGDTWIERLNVPASNMHFGAYGTGVKPIITGLQTLTGFTNVGNIWTATATNSAPKLNTVLVGGAIRAKGRNPNTGYSTFSSYSGSPKINSIVTDLSGTPNYTGAEVVGRSTHFTIDVATITSQSGGTLNFSPGWTYDNTYGGNGYFIQNVESVLDVAGEWCYDSATKVFKVYSTTSPTVQISTMDTVVFIHNKDNVKFDGIAFSGGNKSTIQADSSDYVTVTNCTVDNSGSIGISAQKCDYITITYDSIRNSLSGGAYLRQVDPYTPMQNTCLYATVQYNYIKNTGIWAGMGLNDNCRYVGVYLIGTGGNVSYNRVDSTGFNSLVLCGQNSLCEKNYITLSNFVKDDGGGINTGIGAYIDANYNDGSIIRNNIIIDCPGATTGVSDASYAGGVYCDNYSRFLTVDSNTVSNCRTSAIFLNENNNINVYENLTYNNIGSGLTIAGSNALVGSLNNIKRNIFYTNHPGNVYGFVRTFGTTIGSMDSNYYSKPLDETVQVYFGANLSRTAWISASGYDVNSSGTPSTSTGASGLFYYNPTFSDSTITLPTAGVYVDSKSNQYTGTITLHSFRSAILYLSTVKIRVKQGFKFYKGQLL